jgi:hypothetical protein
LKSDFLQTWAKIGPPQASILHSKINDQSYKKIPKVEVSVRNTTVRVLSKLFRNITSIALPRYSKISPLEFSTLLIYITSRDLPHCSKIPPPETFHTVQKFHLQRPSTLFRNTSSRDLPHCSEIPPLETFHTVQKYHL